MVRLGIAIQDTWSFFNEIYDYLIINYETTLFHKRNLRLPFFQSRVNRYLNKHDLQAFMKSNDVVFFEWASGLLADATHLPKYCRIITRLHRFELYEWADRINWDAVDKIILVSKAKQQEFITKFPDHSQKTSISYPSISLNRFSLRPKEFAGDLGILCHITPRKRVYDLILLLYELLQKKDGFRLHIAGGVESAHQDYYDAIIYIVNKLSLQDKVIFYGNVSDSWNWYHNIDIFISNSYSEGLQVAPMEAMASGCYCISHFWNGADELLPPENLFLTNDDLLEKIIAYSNLSDSEKQKQRERMRDIACLKFDIKETEKHIRRVIEETVREKLQ